MNRRRKVETEDIRDSLVGRTWVREGPTETELETEIYRENARENRSLCRREDESPGRTEGSGQNLGMSGELRWLCPPGASPLACHRAVAVRSQEGGVARECKTGQHMTPTRPISAEQRGFGKQKTCLSATHVRYPRRSTASPVLSGGSGVSVPRGFICRSEGRRETSSSMESLGCRCHGDVDGDGIIHWS